MMTFGALFDQLGKLAKHVDRDLPVRINGEYVDRCSVALQNPIAKVRDDRSELQRLEHDKSRSQVIDITVNDHESPKLPVMEYDFRRW